MYAHRIAIARMITRRTSTLRKIDAVPRIRGVPLQGAVLSIECITYLQ